MEEAPNEADRKPESVTPICTVDREGVRVTCDFGDFGAASVLLLHLLDLRAAQRDHCQLGAGEHGTDNEKYKNQEDVQTK